MSGPLLPKEIDLAEHYWSLSAQTQLGDWKERYKDVAPFKKEGIVRVGGRIKHSPLSYDNNHPVSLPTEHIISKLVIKDAHNRVCHAGRERTLCETRRKFWIPRRRNLVKEIVRKCVTLAWGALFTCATVHAIHLEIVEDLSSEAFLHALRQFVSHHGWPTTIISDNGTSFVGCERELKKLLQEGKKGIEEFVIVHKVKWKFNTPLSPHQAGFFETMIKQMKKVLRVIVGEQVLTWNEMATVFAEVQCLVNSCPLGNPSNDANDLQPITPNHFILGRATTEIPQGPFRETKNSRKRFEFIQALAQQFWNRFHWEYLQTLMQ